MPTWAELASRIKWHAWRHDPAVRERLGADLAGATGLSWAGDLLPALAALIDAVPGHQGNVGQSTRLFGMGAGALSASHGDILRRRMHAVVELSAGLPADIAPPLARAFSYWVADHPANQGGEASVRIVSEVLCGDNAPDPTSGARACAVGFLDFTRSLADSGELTAEEVTRIVAFVKARIR